MQLESFYDAINRWHSDNSAYTMSMGMVQVHGVSFCIYQNLFIL